MKLSDLFSPCLFGHASHPLIVMRGKAMYHQCRSCHANLGQVLKGQKFKQRKQKAKPLRSVAKVLSGGRFQ